MTAILRTLTWPALLLGAITLIGAANAADKDEAYALTVENASAKVGDKAIIKAVLTATNGHKVSKAYRNRLIELSAEDEGSVEFEKPVVRGTVQDDTSVVFDIGVTPMTAGSHTINGVFRFGFHSDGRMNMLSIPLVAEVTGTE